MHSACQAFTGGTGAKASAPTIIAVVVTYDRPALLRRCLTALQAQRRPPDAIIVVDDASPAPDTAAAISCFRGVRHLRHVVNRGGAAAYRTGIEAALAAGADFVWLMDDDGLPAEDTCLDRLVTRAEFGVGIAAPLVLDRENPARLAFPIRVAGRTRFIAEEVSDQPRIPDFAHLFNGALVRAEVFATAGLPDPRFVCRGDEVEFMLRARRSGFEVCIETTARFLHPGSQPEIHPILSGAFYATVPTTEAKRHHQFRNRGYIFRAYGMWAFLFADMLRYGCHYLLRRRPDPAAFGRWLSATAEGWRGAFLKAPPSDRTYVELSTPATPETEPGLVPARDDAG